MPTPREVFDDPATHWALITSSSDTDFETQFFDRKEATRRGNTGGVSLTYTQLLNSGGYFLLVRRDRLQAKLLYSKSKRASLAQQSRLNQEKKENCVKARLKEGAKMRLIRYNGREGKGYFYFNQ